MKQTLSFPALLAVVTSAACLLLNPVHAAAPPDEQQLISVLKSDAPAAEKAITCKKLAVYGGKDAVPALAPLLLDKDLSSWARIALEAISDPAADEALRAALDKTQDRLLIGIINSIGYRRDAKAVTKLIAKLKEADVEIVSAAAVALGCIGGEAAAKALENSLPTVPAGARGAVAEGCIRGAARFLTEGRPLLAARLYDKVRQANVPKQRMLEATRGAILARGSAGLPLLLEQLRAKDKAMLGIGLRTAREMPGREVTRAVANEVDRADAERQTQLVLVLADRADATVLPTVRKAAQTGSRATRLAAIAALERMGAAEAVPVLLQLATQEDREVAQSAMATLGRLPGKEANAILAARLAQATGKGRQVLLELAGQRLMTEALPVAVQCVGDAEAGVRAAALGAIGLLGDENQAADLVGRLEKTQPGAERTELEKALLAICRRRGAPCAAVVLPLARNAGSELRLIALRALSAVGGPAALGAVKAALEDRDETVQDEAVRALATWASNWPDDAGVAEPLLTLAQSGKKPAHKVLGLRGYLEYVPGAKQLKDAEKVAKVKELLPLITRAEEKRLAIAAVSSVPTQDALDLVMNLAADAEIAEEAYLAAVNLAARNDLPGAATDLRRKALETVAEKSKSDRTRRKAQEALGKLK